MEPTAATIEVDTGPVYVPFKEFAARHPGVSGWLLGELVRKGELPHVRLGRRVMVRVDALDVMEARQRQEREVRRAIDSEAA